LTVSFVPDGTDVDGPPSQLYQKMALSGLSQSVWQGTILSALESWSAVTNVNFSVVGDNGAPLGAPGAVQGDPHFGDIRIACRPLSGDVLALTTPPGTLAGTRAGDIVFNSNDLFTVGSGLLGLNQLNLLGGVVNQDLSTVALHEIGHALGLPDLSGSTPDQTSSIMYGSYRGLRTLNSLDIADIQALYGTPAPDSLALAGANVPSTAWALQAPPGAPANASLSVTGDLNSSTDVNYFKYTTGWLNPNGLTVKLQTSNQSLLAGKIAIYSSGGWLLGSANASGPGQDLSLSLGLVAPNTSYYILVDRASGTAFNQGAYQLTVISNPNAPTVSAPGTPAPHSDGGTNETFNTATLLQTTPGYLANTHYSVSATLGSATDVNVYAFQAATPPAGQPNALTLLLQAQGGPLPAVTVFDANQNVVATQVFANGAGSYLVQLPSAQPGALYFAAIAAKPGTPAGSQYRLAINFNSQVVTPEVDAQGTLSQQNRGSLGLLSISQSDLKYFTLSVNGNNPAEWVTMTITTLLGQLVATLTARAGQTVGTTALLNSGLYIITFSSGTDDGSPFLPIDYVLDSVSISQPIGSTLSNPNKSPSGSGPSSTSKTTASTSSPSNSSSGSSA
jgi:hypothetical protein